MWTKVFSVTAVLSTAALGACSVESGDVGTAQDDLKAKVFCGGIANFPCPSGFECTDDPSDNCDPKKGGADCGGYCKKTPAKKCQHAASDYIAQGTQCQLVKFFCVQGKEPFFDNCGCGCTSTQCAPSACGPALGMPNHLCPDGVTVAGPTGNCLKHADGTCGWEVLSCP